MKEATVDHVAVYQPCDMQQQLTMIAWECQAHAAISTPSPPRNLHGFFHHEELEEHEDLGGNVFPPDKTSPSPTRPGLKTQANSLTDLARQSFHRYHPASILLRALRVLRGGSPFLPVHRPVWFSCPHNGPPQEILAHSHLRAHPTSAPRMAAPTLRHRATISPGT